MGSYAYEYVAQQNALSQKWQTKVSTIWPPRSLRIQNPVSMLCQAPKSLRDPSPRVSCFSVSTQGRSRAGIRGRLPGVPPNGRIRILSNGTLPITQPGVHQSWVGSIMENCWWTGILFKAFQPSSPVFQALKSPPQDPRLPASSKMSAPALEERMRSSQDTQKLAK